MLAQEFKIEERVEYRAVTKQYVLWCKPAYGDKMNIEAVIKWHTAYFGYVLEFASLGGAIAPNVLAEVVTLLDALNNNKPNIHITVDTNPF